MVKEEKLNELIKQNENQKEQCQKIINKLSLIRLIAFFAFAILLVTSIVQFSFWFLGGTIISLVLFIVLISLHEKRFQEYALLENIIKVLNEYKSRLNYGWYKFIETGDNLINELPSFTSDIDICGEHSLFQYLNVSKTLGGKKKLLSLLIDGQDNIEVITKTRESIKDYALSFNDNVVFQAYLKDFDKKIYRIKKQAISFPKNKKGNPLTFIVGFILSGATLASIVLSILKIVSPSLIFIFMLSQLILSYVGKDKELLNSIDSAALYYHSLKNVYLQINEFKFEDQNNINNQNKIKNALSSINKLGRIQQLASIYHNGISNLLANLLMPFNDLLIAKYLKFSIDNPSILEESIDALNYFEVIASLANINFSKDNICEPQISEKVELEFNEVKHPLLSEKECISNSFSLTNNINLITGSNMSGKTSFIRTIATNIVLMKAGAFVLASSFKASNYQLFTSMRVKDDIQNGISTFYAELLRIKEALDYSTKNKPMILMVDEIFKGTNMNDRLLGAKSVMKKLDLDHVILFITTHDFELCDYEEVELTNYHFSEQYEDNKIKFDYKIKDGKCKTTNAIYLMKNTGVMD